MEIALTKLTITIDHQMQNSFFRARNLIVNAQPSRR